jgi:hypothetical protein
VARVLELAEKYQVTLVVSIHANMLLKLYLFAILALTVYILCSDDLFDACDADAENEQRHRLGVTPQMLAGAQTPKKSNMIEKRVVPQIALFGYFLLFCK